MSSVATAVGEAPGRARRFAPGIWAVYGLCGLLLAGYLGSLLVRAPDQRSTLLDGWLIDSFELVVCALAFARGVLLPRGRTMPLVLGVAMSLWAIGDVALTIESRGGASPGTPSTADFFYLGFFVVAYLALVMMVRRNSSRLVPAIWLDGVAAGLGAAALCAALAFPSIAHATGDGALTVATNLAYPVGDVLLLGLVVGGSAILSKAVRGPWALIAAGCALNAVGDTFNLFHTAETTQLGAVFDGIAWPGSLLLMSAAVWVRPARLDFLAHQRAPGFFLPALGGASALAVLLLASTDGGRVVAVALATATLLAAGIRLALSVGSLRKLTEERHRQAVTDQLTGLGNRRRLAQVLDGFFADPTLGNGTLAFLFVDLNHFKEVNDSFGHSAGDQLLRQIGPRIEACLGRSDLLLRIGGDELAVLLHDANAVQAARVAERISDAIRETFVLDMVSVQIDASIGIAIAPDHAACAEELMARADQAMYQAKQTGAVFELYDPTRHVEIDRLRLLEELRAAIDEQQFELHYQPLIELRNGTLQAVEALLRWPHPRLGLVPPLDFLPLAEGAGLMRPLTSLVLDQALEQCARWRADGQPLAVAVNVSATNILDAQFTALVREQLRRHRLPANALVLEITETTVISDYDRCKRVIEELRQLGCVVSIDDFGAGFTSLAHLSKLSISELKLDRTFLAALASDERNLTLVRATIELAHALGLQVVAEGVEEQATLDTLGRLGCDLAQGYHIGRPKPAAALALTQTFAADESSHDRSQTPRLGNPYPQAGPLVAEFVGGPVMCRPACARS